MKRITTHHTFEDAPIPILFPYVSTPIACLAREVSRDVQAGLPEQAKFILGESEQLGWTPTSELAHSFGAFSSSVSHLHSRGVQFFEGNSVTIAICDCFADAVVGVSDEPSLSSTQETKMSLCASSACSLQDATQISIASLHFPEMFSVEELSVTCDCGVDESSINSEDTFRLANLWFDDLELNIEKDSTMLLTQGCGSSSFDCVSFESVSRDCDVILAPAGCGADAHDVGIEEGLEGVMIQPHGTSESFDWSLLELESLEHFTCLVTNCRDEATVQCRICLADFSISGFVQFGFAECLAFESSVYRVLTGAIGDVQSIEKGIVRVQDSFSHGKHHDTPYNHNTYICIVLFEGDESPKDETFSIQHSLSSRLVSEVSQESPRGRSEDSRRRYHQRGLHQAWLASRRTLCATRPRSRFHQRSSDIQSTVRREGLEGQHGSSSREGVSVRQEVLESELLRRDSRYSHAGYNPAIYSGTREGGVTRFTTATRLRCPLAS